MFNNRVKNMQLQNQLRGVSSLVARTTAERLLADIRDLAPGITARAAEIESGRRIPLDLVETLRSIGVFRMVVPESHGGLEFDLPTVLEVIRTLSRIDGSVGWTAMIGNGGGIIASRLQRETYDRVYRNGPDALLAGSMTPGGTAEAVPGGWRVGGRWPFASGCLHADWMMGFCVMIKDGEPLAGPAGAGGPPPIRGVALPADDWQIEDTWYASGLKGTGSHHIVLKDTVVPAANFFDIPAGTPCVRGPLYGAPAHFLPLLHGAFDIGAAEGALNELVAHANTGRKQLRAVVPMRESETFQGELGRIEADLKAARAFHQAQVASHWRHARAGTLANDPALLIQGTQTAIWVAATCVRVAEACFRLGGGSAIYESSPLQRRLRDLQTSAQHAVVQQQQYASVGKLLLDTIH